MQTQLEMVHPEKYAAAIKVADKFVAKNSLRMMLQLVQHKEDGSLIATDTHRLIKIQNAHGFKEEYLVNVKSLEFAKGQYPNTEHIFGDTHKTFIRLNEQQIKIWLQMHKSINQMTKIKNFNHDFLTMKMEQEHITFEIKNKGISFKLPFEEIELDETADTISYQIEYMRDALESLVVMQSKQVMIKLSSPMRPILLENGIDVEAFILPIRTA